MYELRSLCNQVPAIPRHWDPTRKDINSNTKNEKQKIELILPGMWFTLECLPSMGKALSSSPNNVKPKRKRVHCKS